MAAHAENRILNCLSAADMAEIQPSLKNVTLVQGAVLHEAGGPIEFIYFPLSGMVSKLVVMKSGQRVETGVVGKEGVVGASIGNSGPLAFGQATVQIEGSAWQMPSSKFLMMFNKSEGLRKLVNEFQGFIFFQAQQSAACHAVHTVEARLCR